MSVNLLVDGCQGVYIPKIFADGYNSDEWNCEEEDFEILKDPEHELYWDVWCEVLANAKLLDNQGNTWRLWQDGDLWVYCYELMTDMEIKHFFGE